MAGKYEPLARALKEASDDVEFTFGGLDELVGGLPPSARTHREWWANAANSSNPHTRAWLDAGYIAATVDVSGERVRFVRGSPEERAGGRRGSRPSVVLDGVAALARVLDRAGYPSAMHAVAAHAIFLHPSTVMQTNGQALFPTIRDFALRGQLGHTDDGRRVLLDDNTSPTLAFCWSAMRKKGPDVQFNHVFADSRNPDIYTALWNLCATPAFLAKTSDGKNHPDVVAALQRRSFDLYGNLPAGEPEPERPDGYDELEWATPPPPVEDLEVVLRGRLNSAVKSRPALAAREIGWLYSDWRPDSQINPA